MGRLAFLLLLLPLDASAAKIMLFGGHGHRTYLGCLSCDSYATDSVLNSYGSYGSEYSMTSIFNHYGMFGSEYSNYSACSNYATDPPVIVDQNGNYYGRLTLNPYRDQTSAENVVRWLVAVCSG